jgi:hypothetical protein
LGGRCVWVAYGGDVWIEGVVSERAGFFFIHFICLFSLVSFYSYSHSRSYDCDSFGAG